MKDKGVKIADRMTAIIGLVECLTEPIQYFRLSGMGAAIGIIFALIYLTVELIKLEDLH